MKSSSIHTTVFIIIIAVDTPLELPLPGRNNESHDINYGYILHLTLWQNNYFCNTVIKFYY